MRKVDVKLLILLESSKGDVPIDGGLLRRCIREVLLAAGVSHGSYEISLCFVDDMEMRRLNAEYRGLRRTTDVLSFPQFTSIGEITAGPDGMTVLGDVVISLETLGRRCRNRRENPGRELIRLLAHGVLHLLDFDHKMHVERKEMRLIEDRVIDTVLP